MEGKTKKTLLIVLTLLLPVVIVSYLVSINTDVEFSESLADEEQGIEISMFEEARNASNSQTTPSEVVFSVPDDTVEVTLQISSSSPTSGSNTTLKAFARPVAGNVSGTGVSYIPGSTLVSGSTVSDGIMSSGIALSSFSEAGITVKYRIRILPKSNWPVGTSVLDIDPVFTIDGATAKINTTQNIRLLVTNDLVTL